MLSKRSVAQVLVLLVMALVAGYLVHPAQMVQATTSQAAMHLSAPQEGYVLGGMFYFNPKDPAISVPKASGLGWTLNFGNYRAWGILLAIIVIVVAIRLGRSRKPRD